eukprot:scaffold6685_cov202-Prasinococcus_capsulatus_cf.AAC.6
MSCALPDAQALSSYVLHSTHEDGGPGVEGVRDECLPSDAFACAALLEDRRPRAPGTRLARVACGTVHARSKRWRGNGGPRWRNLT